MNPDLTLSLLKREISSFTQNFAKQPVSDLFGATDGKKVGTYVEQVLNRHLIDRYSYVPGNSASGIDFPTLGVDLKVTSVNQPQSSCPFRDAGQKIFGLGYHLIILTYEKKDDETIRAARLTFLHAVFVESQHTADFQTTSRLLELLRQSGNEDDIDAFLEERMLPVDEVGRRVLARRILNEPPQQGYLTISNALQWRLQYDRVNKLAVSGTTEGVQNLFA